MKESWKETGFAGAAIFPSLVLDAMAFSDSVTENGAVWAVMNCPIGCTDDWMKEWVDEWCVDPIWLGGICTSHNFEWAGAVWWLVAMVVVLQVSRSSIIVVIKSRHMDWH